MLTTIIAIGEVIKVRFIKSLVKTLFYLPLLLSSGCVSSGEFSRSDDIRIIILVFGCVFLGVSVISLFAIISTSEAEKRYAAIGVMIVAFIIGIIFIA